VLLLLAVLLLVPVHAGSAAIVVVTTTQDLKSLTEAVGKELVNVVCLVPPGADAEGYEPRPSDLLHLANAAIIVRVGLGYDDWLDRLLTQHGNLALARGGSGHVDA
jgi:manganese/iron transport system substrate-binding protein